MAELTVKEAHDFPQGNLGFGAQLFIFHYHGVRHVRHFVMPAVVVADDAGDAQSVMDHEIYNASDLACCGIPLRIDSRSEARFTT